MTQNLPVSRREARERERGIAHELMSPVGVAYGQPSGLIAANPSGPMPHTLTYPPRHASAPQPTVAQANDARATITQQTSNLGGASYQATQTVGLVSEIPEGFEAYMPAGEQQPPAEDSQWETSSQWEEVAAWSEPADWTQPASWAEQAGLDLSSGLTEVTEQNWSVEEPSGFAPEIAYSEDLDYSSEPYPQRPTGYSFNEHEEAYPQTQYTSGNQVYENSDYQETDSVGYPGQGAYLDEPAGYRTVDHDPHQVDYYGQNYAGELQYEDRQGEYQVADAASKVTWPSGPVPEVVSSSVVTDYQSEDYGYNEINGLGGPVIGQNNQLRTNGPFGNESFNRAPFGTVLGSDSDHENSVPASPTPPTPPAGHWVSQLDTPENVDTQTAGNIGSLGTPTTTNALILPTLPDAGSFAGPLAETGEILVTGSVDLPSSLGAIGAHPNQIDSVELDRMFDRMEVNSPSSAIPVAAAKAVSARTSVNNVVAPPKKERPNVPLVLAVTAGVLALGVVSTLVVGAMTGIL